MEIRVARWFIFNPKSQFWRAMEWKVFSYFMIIRNILWPFGIIYGSLVYLVCGHLLYIFLFWHVWTKKNLATLMEIPSSGRKLEK
jgi:hypothetical protein